MKITKWDQKSSNSGRIFADVRKEFRGRMEITRKDELFSVSKMNFAYRNPTHKPRLCPYGARGAGREMEIGFAPRDRQIYRVLA